MEWEQIRAHFVRLWEIRKAEGKRQEDIALAGGLERQNQISRVLTSKGPRGPSVRIFINAVIGLGLQPSEFFAQLEREHATGLHVVELKQDASKSHTVDPARFAAAQAAFWQVLAGAKPQPRKRKPHR